MTRKLAAVPQLPATDPGSDVDAANAAAIRVGTCIEVQHPTLTGRVRVRVEESGTVSERWLPCLHGITVRELDRVLLQQPSNWLEPIVTGVIDGFARRPDATHLDGPALTLQRDEAVRIQAPDGTPLIEVFQEDAGPVVRLLNDDVDLDIKGRLRLRAHSIELAAERGGMNLSAADDVIVVGEAVRLN